MSSTLDAGYQAEQERKTQDTKCKKSPTKEHQWKTYGSWPSTWSKCKHCKTETYSK